MFPDYVELLQCLNASKVKYLIIGGYAVIRYAEPRYTKDLDIWIEASPQNAKRVYSALKEFGAPIDNLTVAELATPGLVYIFGIPPIRVDILNRAKGATFPTAWKSRQKVPLDGTYAYFVDIRNLRKLKRAAGRAQDLADLEALEGVKG